MRKRIGWREDEMKCVVCGCTESDCEECMIRTGEPCGWDPLWREPVCTACSGPYYLVRMNDTYAGAMLSTCTRIMDLILARRFALERMNPVRAEMILARIMQLDPEWEGGKTTKLRTKIGKGRG